MRVAILFWVLMSVNAHFYAQKLEDSSIPISPSAPISSIFSEITAFPGSAITNSITNRAKSPLLEAQLGEHRLSSREVARIERIISQLGVDLSEADISKAGLFGIIDAETQYFNNPDLAAGAKVLDKKTLDNPFMQFLYAKNIANGEELLSHKTNSTTLFNINGVYNLRFALQKDASLAPKLPFAKRGELEFLLFSPKTFAPINTYDQKIVLTLYGVDNKLKWTKEFTFNGRQAQQTQMDVRIRRLVLNHLLDKEELDDLRNLFRANQVIFGRIDGVLDSFLFDFQPKTTHFYRSFLEYGKVSRYF